jgi:hypothetical protein
LDDFNFNILVFQTLPVDAMDPSLKMAEEKFVAALTQFGPALNMWKNATGGGGGTVTEGTQTEQQFAVIQSVLLAEDRFAAKRAAFEEASFLLKKFFVNFLLFQA